MKKFLDLLDLTKTQDLCIYEFMEVVDVVHKDKNIVIAAFQIIEPSFKGLNNS